jgi:hypothetical protein
MVPALIRYTDDMPAWMGGYARWFYIAIRPKYKDDKGIHQHELEHVKQWWLTTIWAAMVIGILCWWQQAQFVYVALSLAVYQLLYTAIPLFKLHCEVEAYKQQLKHYADDRVSLFGKFIADKYGLKITAEEAGKLLKG